jgi:hypothetical protein
MDHSNFSETRLDGEIASPKPLISYASIHIYVMAREQIALTRRALRGSKAP